MIKNQPQKNIPVDDSSSIPLSNSTISNNNRDPKQTVPLSTFTAKEMITPFGQVNIPGKISDNSTTTTNKKVFQNRYVSNFSS